MKMSAGWSAEVRPTRSIPRWGARHLRRPSLLPVGSGHLKKIVVPTVIFPPGSAKVPGLVRCACLCAAQSPFDSESYPNKIAARVERTNSGGASPHMQSGSSKSLSVNGSSNTRRHGRPPVGLAKAVFPKTNRVNAENRC
jgi:hypothetical protein